MNQRPMKDGGEVRTPVWRKTARQRDLCEKTANRPLLMTGPFGKYSEKNKSPGRRSEDGKRAANIAGARIQRLGKQQRSLIGETDDKSSKNEKPRFLPQTEGMQEGEKERFSCEKQYTIMALGRWDVRLAGAFPISFPDAADNPAGFRNVYIYRYTLRAETRSIRGRRISSRMPGRSSISFGGWGSTTC